MICAHVFVGKNLELLHSDSARSSSVMADDEDVVFNVGAGSPVVACIGVGAGAVVVLVVTVPLQLSLEFASS